MLTQVAGAQVCPSDDVDQAWHLHITRTADYERFCRDVLGAFLHHHPAPPGADEHQRHRGMYVGTLAHYRRAFGAAPPKDVWPDVDTRFAPAPAGEAAIALRGGLDVPGILALVALLGVAVLALLLGESGVLDATHALSGPAFLSMALPVTAALLALAWLSTGPFDKPGPRTTLDVYEAAWLAGGTPRVATTAIGMLVDRGALRLQTTERRKGFRRSTTTQLVLAIPQPLALHPVEIACLAGARQGTLEYRLAEIAVRQAGARIGERLRRAGLASESARIAPARAGAALLLVGWLAIEFERFVHALGTPRPVAFLVMLMLAGTAGLLRLVIRGRATWRGAQTLASLRNHLVRRRSRQRDDSIGLARLPMTLALLGPAAVLAQPGFAGLDDAIGPHGMRVAGFADGSSGSGGDGGGGGGCGGGGCGGGCGG